MTKQKQQARLLTEIKERYDEDGKAIVERAFDYAQRAHTGQRRKSGAEYISHPVAVAHTLSELKADAETVAAGLLHDIVEDTKLTLAEVKDNFGENIAFLVDAVSNLGGIDYFSQEETFAENFRKMILASAKDIRVVLIKLADVLHNMRTLDALPAKQQVRYAQEVLEIYAPIAARLGIGWLKGELEDLAFPYVRPEEHRDLVDRCSDLIERNKRYIEKLKPKVTKLIANEKILPERIDARTKHLYSLWQKIKRCDNDLSKIYDLVALRIIVDDIPTCYKTLGVLHKHWTPLPGHIKDYIATPKPNGYQSIHTTVFADEGKITEFQIRTVEMHQEAKFGIAAHWAYKERVRPFKKNLTWIQQLGEWQKAVGSDEFLESLKIDFFKGRIFVFTPKGGVIDLPEGATPVDFAYAIHSDLGDRVRLAKVNGKPVQLSSALKNNDLVEIVTAKNKKPSRDWLIFVKTSKARSKIRNALRREGIIG